MQISPFPCTFWHPTVDQQSIQKEQQSFWNQFQPYKEFPVSTSSFFSDQQRDQIVKSFSQRLFPRNCSPELAEDISQRMVSITLDSADLLHICTVFEIFKVGQVEAKRVDLQGGYAKMTIVYERIESVFKIFRTPELKYYKYYAHLMDGQNDDESIDSGEMETEDTRSRRNKEKEGEERTHVFSFFQSSYCRFRVMDAVVDKLNHNSGNLRLNF